MTEQILCRHGGSWRGLHVVQPADSLPICGSRDRLEDDVAPVPPSIERRIREGQIIEGVCGTCVRLIAQREGPTR